MLCCRLHFLMVSTSMQRICNFCFRRRFTMAGKQLEPIHDKHNKQFYLHIGNEKAVLQYDKIGPDTLDMYHTEVPESFRGAGVAQILAKAAFKYVVENDLKMKLSCTYLQKYHRDNPSLQHRKRIVD